jgi:hypothetical protein
LTSFTILALGAGGLLDFGVFSALLHQGWRYSRCREAVVEALATKKALVGALCLIDRFGLAQGVHQLDLTTPGSSPLWARSRSWLRQRPKSL